MQAKNNEIKHVTAYLFGEQFAKIVDCKANIKL
jgi:hypothetical protein